MTACGRSSRMVADEYVCLYGSQPINHSNRYPPVVVLSRGQHGHGRADTYGREKSMMAAQVMRSISIGSDIASGMPSKIRGAL
jgi:hypothetical protein